MGSLGLGFSTAQIYARGGETKLLDLDGVAQIGWGRALSAVSQASVLIRLDDAKRCRGSIGDVHTWAHELVVWRDLLDAAGEPIGQPQRVWEGPIRNIKLTSTSVLIDAADVLYWLTRRRITQGRHTTQDHPVSDEGDLIMQRAFEVRDPNVLDHLTVFADDGEAQIQRDVAANSGSYAGDLDTLAGQGLNYTTIGRKTLLWPDEVRIGKTETLVPERDMVTEVTVEEVGDDLATLMTGVNSDGDHATVSVSDADSTGGVLNGATDFYGLHDMILDASDLKRVPAIRRTARRALAHAYPTPVLVTIPDGAKLSCDAPIPMEHLVAGSVVPVESEITPRRVNDDQILSAVNVSQTSDGEDVTVTLTPRAAFGLVEEES